MNKMTSSIFAVALFGAVGGAHAAGIALQPGAQNAALGSTLSFDVYVDFTDIATSGGRFQVTYDSSRLGDAVFAYDSSFASTYGVATGSTALSGIGFTGLFGGAARLGTLSFTATGVGAAAVATAAYANPTYRFRNNTGSSYITVNYGAAAANVSAVPVPAAAWLMASGLSALGLGLRRRQA